MTRDIDRRALELYARALDLPLSAREAFLRAASARDPELSAVLLAMLGVGDAPGEKLESLFERKQPPISALLDLGLEGQQLGDFRLLHEIGRGAVGYVYVAEQISLRRRVAVKVLNPLLAQRAELVQRFLRESETQAKLQHPHIVKVISSSSEGDWHYFAMEHIQGESLISILRREREALASSAPRRFDLPAQHACALQVETIARALHFAHERGVLHRDVKPHNILVESSGQPFVADFGLAKDIDRTALTGTLDDGIKGTLAYMSPEQANEFRSVDARADVYSLGAVLYELITLRPPFEADTGVALLAKVLNAHPPLPHRVVQGLDRSLSAICMRALEKDPDKRYASALSMAEDLRAFRTGSRVTAQAITWYEQVGTRRIDRRVFLGGAAAAVAAVAGVAWTTSRIARSRDGARLRLELDSEATAADVRLLPILPWYSELGAALELGRVRGDAEFDEIAPGSYRIVVVGDGGSFAELERDLAARDAVTARAVLTAPGVSDDSMSLVRAGSVTIGRYAFESAAGEIEFRCPSFWIDRGAVSNREFKQFLDATGRWPLPEWSADWVDVWSGRGSLRRPDDWDELPVVKVSWTAARDYAEWKGKRLPTPAEWMLAVDAPSWLAEAARDGLERHFVLGKLEADERASGPRPSLTKYLKHARAAKLDEAHAYGPNRLWHPIGNVGQWLATSTFQRSDSGRVTVSGLRHCAHSCWYTEHSGDKAKSSVLTIGKGGADASSASPDLGFRCAKSASV